MPLLIAIDDYFDIIIDIAITFITPLIIDYCHLIDIIAIPLMP
jgi:hypothetical protein